MITMKDLYHCKSCGFLSTERKEFTIFENILICKDCKKQYDNNDPDVMRWVDSKLKRR